MNKLLSHSMNRLPSGKEEKKPTLGKRIATGSAIAALALPGGCSGSGESEVAQYQKNQVHGVTQIGICNGARFREDPTVSEDSSTGETNLLTTVNLGDVSDEACVTLPMPKGTFVVLADDLKPYAEANGKWIGITEATANSLLPGANLGESSDNLVWLSTQMASITVDEKQANEL